MFKSSNYWRQQRNEVEGSVGVSNFLGELGGRDQVGSDFVYDLEFAETKYAISVGYRYFVLKNLSVKGALTFAEVSGDDRLTNEPFRNNRNLHFSSQIIELQTQLEFHLTTERSGHRYKIKGARGAKGYAWGIYGFVGIGFFYFNPKAFVEKSGWVELQPLGTEGQTLTGGSGPYSLINVAIPMGMGIRTAVTKEIRIGIDFGVRKTFTDYIDDVSTVYPDKTALAQVQATYADSQNAVFLSDPSLGLYSQGTPGDQRGDATDLDSYMFMQFTIGYKLNVTQKRRYGRYRKKSRKLGGRYKRRRSMPSF